MLKIDNPWNPKPNEKPVTTYILRKSDIVCVVCTPVNEYAKRLYPETVIILRCGLHIKADCDEKTIFRAINEAFPEKMARFAEMTTEERAAFHELLNMEPEEMVFHQRIDASTTETAKSLGELLYERGDDSYRFKENG